MFFISNDKNNVICEIESENIEDFRVSLISFYQILERLYKAEKINAVKFISIYNAFFSVL